MALLFCDSFDHYASAEITRKWTVNCSSTSPTIQAAGRRSTNAIRFSSGSPGLGRFLGSNQSTLTVGAAFCVAASGIYAGGNIMTFSYYTSEQIGLRVNGTGQLYVSLGGAYTYGPASGVTIQPNVWYYLELKVTIHNTNGSYEVRVNGVNVLSGSGVDTSYYGTTDTANHIFIGATKDTAAGVNPVDYWYLDDLYVTDSTGSYNTGFLGDVRVDATFPSGAGNSTQWSVNTGNNYAAVDDTTDADDDTTYVYETTVGDKDLYAFGDISHNPSNIYGTQILACARHASGGTRTINLVTRSGSTDYDSSAIAPNASYSYVGHIREVDPYTSAAWSKTNLNNAEFGLKIAS